MGNMRVSLSVKLSDGIDKEKGESINKIWRHIPEDKSN